MRVQLADGARADVLAAARWYDEQRPGLGDEFVDAVLAAGVVIEANPLAWPTWPAIQRDPPVRRHPMRRFPVYFQVLPELIEVIAIGHGRRRPGHWLRR